MAIHECAGKQAHWRLAMVLCAVFLLAATVTAAQTEPAKNPWLDQDVVGPVSTPQPPTSQPEQTSQPAPTLTAVHGVVRNAASGAPMPRALVLIEGDAEAGALTDGEGRFELSGVPIGPVVIRVRKPGFQDRPYATEDANYQGDGPAHSVLVVAEMPDLEFTLTPTSAIHGHIELSTGDPAEGIQITLLKQVIRNGRAVWAQNGSTKTNGGGTYRFANLSSGVYTLFTQPTLENEPAATALAPGAKVALNGYPTIFFPQAREFSGAIRIRLKAGEQAEANLQLALEPFYMVKATAILPNGKTFEGKGLEQAFGSPEPVLAAAVLDTAGRELPYKATFNAAAHTVEAALPDGSYTLLIVAAFPSGVRSSSPRNPQNKAKEETDQWIAFEEFSVDGQAVKKLHLPLSPQPSWPIHLRAVYTSAQPVQANASRELQNLVTVTATMAGDAPMGDAGADAMAEDVGLELLDISGAGFGPHWIGTQLNDRSLCVDSFSAGGVNLAREPLNVALGASPPPMELTLSDNCAKLALTLPPALADFLPGEEPFYTVYVVPDFDTTADIPPMTVHPSSGATLTADGLTPGSYHVYVFDQPVRLEYRNPAVLAALPTPGQQVTLSAGATVNLMLEVPGR